jgi:hypothetical protein
MSQWHNVLKYDPIAPLLKSGHSAIFSHAQCELLEKALPFDDLWQLPEPHRIVKRQKLDGSWLYHGGNKQVRSQENYDQIETYRNLRILVEQFALKKDHPAIQKAAEYLFAFQTQAGDLRGIYGNQYSPNYSAGITELLIRAGYEDDARVKSVLEWLISLRQTDGGWAIPFRTRDRNIDVISAGLSTIDPDRSKPFSHMVTGVVLRAFAAHPRYRGSKEALQASQLLHSHFFKRDNYPDRAAPEYWLRFSFPFWFTDLISALDSLSQLGISRAEPNIDTALTWFIENQQETGLWELKITMGRNRDVLQLWLALAICKIFKRFYDHEPIRHG